MKLSASYRSFFAICVLCLVAGPLASSSRAGLIPWVYESIFGTSGYGYSAGYGGYYGAPAGYGYTAGYGGGYGGCCLGGLFHGCGLFGHHRPAYAGYAPGYCAPACGTGCDPCGVSSSYSLGGVCCPTGCATGNCGIGNCSSGDCGIATVPYSGEPASSGSGSGSPSTPNRTYREDEGDGFQPPRSIQGTGGQEDFSSPPDTGPGSGLITPPDDEPATPDSEIERGDDGFQFNYKIPAKDRTEETRESEQRDDESRAAEPLDIDSRVAFRLQPDRSRAHYRVVFRTPAVRRARVTPGSEWQPVEAETRLADNR